MTTSYTSPIAATTRALMDAVNAALSSGDLVAAKAATKALAAFLEALPESGGKVIKLSDHRPIYRRSIPRAA